MPDSKITALTSIGASTDPANDPLVLVDVSDTSMTATGTTKKVTLNQLLGASGTATFASATITGDLTVDTSTLKVDSANNRVGILTASPAYPLSVAGRISYSGGIGEGADLTVSSSGASLLFGNSATWTQQLWYIAGSEAMRLNSSGLGVGVTPSGTGGCLQLKSGITFPATQVASSDANTLDDYEEGTFTPTIQGATTSGVGTYTAQNGRYTKVGNLVTFQVFIDWTAHTGAGNMRIGNLPFTNGGNFWAGSVGYSNGIALSAGFVMTGYVESGQSWVTLQQYPTGGGGTTGIPMDTAGAIIFSASYTV